jgi:phage host-nuclease inhibitor protein Gam
MTPPATATDSPPETFPWEDSEADVDLENWTPLDLVVPERLLWQLQVVQRRIATLREQVRAMREPIDRWEDRQLHPLAERAAYLEQALEEMGRRYREADPERNKTLVLPHGRVETRTGRPGLDITDEQALIGFVRNVAAELDQPVENYLAEKVQVKKDAIKGLLAPEGLENGVAVMPDGTQVPGLEVRKAEMSVSVKVDP